MKNFNRTLILGLVASVAMFAQGTTLTATTTAAAMTSGARTISLTSATGITAPDITTSSVGTQLYVVDIGQMKGEVMNVLSISGTIATVARFSGPAVAHASGAMVLASAPNNFFKYDPTGSCTRAQTQVTPHVNTLTGSQWQCSTQTGTWIPSWGTPGSDQVVSSTAYTVPAGPIVVGGPLITTDTGTAAGTSVSPSVGWNGQKFCVIPGGAFTFTATNNIEKAGTAVADRTLCFTWNAKAAAFAPSY